MANDMDYRCPQSKRGITRQTASRHLVRLSAVAFAETHLFGKAKYFVNQPLIALFLRVSDGAS